ncbi:hypothetical protein C8A03DRAFT_38758 [Achaetomium macrosporum]|uniref:Uncharacterized protein n=1 Tax=Achaetomium macrosporum TaxID=79813 RepID=A0AAN7H3N4_9PEZI|nr:hypothetical protein C8A03DRAFT_38758 [Achaetomium macrosporum]
MPELVFVPADGLGSTRAEDRKLISSHGMLGKNKREYKEYKVVWPAGTASAFSLLTVAGKIDNVSRRLLLKRDSGEPPQFFMDPISWSPIFEPLIIDHFRLRFKI